MEESETPIDKRAAIETALRLMGRGTAASSPGEKSTHVLPSAAARNSIELLVNYGDIDTLTQHNPNIRGMAGDLFNWPGDGLNRATKSVAKALGAALTGTDNSGRSTYPQAVEMAAFAAAAARLLQPDRLARLLSHAGDVSTAFAPNKYTLQLAGAMSTVLENYQEQRREQLLVSMWNQYHNGRWWDMTSGVAKLKTGRPAQRGKQQREMYDAHQGAVRELLADAEIGTSKANDILVGALIDGALPWHESTADLVSALPYSRRLHSRMADASADLTGGKPVDPDTALHASLLPWLPIRDRPEAPAFWLLRVLAAGYTDRDTKQMDVSLLPNRPKQFADMYPEAGAVGFPFPAGVYGLDRSTIETGDGNIVVEVVKNPAELAENRDYMGNCTMSFKGQMESGGYVLFRLWHNEQCYNASTRHVQHAWVLDDINSRFNGGDVPNAVRDAFTHLLPGLPPALDVHTTEANSAERVLVTTRYSAV